MHVASCVHNRVPLACCVGQCRRQTGADRRQRVATPEQLHRASSMNRVTRAIHIIGQYLVDHMTEHHITGNEAMPPLPDVCFPYQVRQP
jgi:hypothetical protein